MSELALGSTRCCALAQALDALREAVGGLVHDMEGAPDRSSLSPGLLRWDGAPRLVAGQETDGEAIHRSPQRLGRNLSRSKKIGSAETIATGKTDS